ncbi:MAG TPA: alpha/beta fold hydrolase [Candidatus Tectomicrobia bacterium]|nr:alpha/beta fold hydrolase [Candidatus Tectomicrobia bacterium]
MTRADLRRVRLASGIELEYAECGAGPAIVLVHGYGDSWFSFSDLLRRLPGDRRALAPTLRGHGDCDRPASGYRILDFAADVLAFMDAAGVERAAVVGHSMGSLVAQEVALARPDRVSHLVLEGSATALEHPAALELARSIRALRDPIPREFVVEFQASAVHRPVPEDFVRALVDEGLKMPARVWHAAFDGILAHRPGDRLRALTMPTLVVWGDRDEICPRVEQDRLLAGIPGARLLVYEGTGHSPHWEEPDRFVADLLAFLDT